MHISTVLSRRYSHRVPSVMQIFRCYALNQHGSIVAREDIEAPALSAVIETGWSFVAQSCAAECAERGLEIWQGETRLFSTLPDTRC